MSALRQARRRSSLGLGPLTGRCRSAAPFPILPCGHGYDGRERSRRARALQLVTEQPRRRRGARSPERGRDARGRPVGSLRPDPIRRRRRHPFPLRAAGRVPARASEHMRVLKVLRRGNRERARRGRRRIVRARPRCDRRRRHLTRVRRRLVEAWHQGHRDRQAGRIGNAEARRARHRQCRRGRRHIGDDHARPKSGAGAACAAHCSGVVAVFGRSGAAGTT